MINKILRLFLFMYLLFCALECRAFDEAEQLAASLKAVPVPSVLHTVSGNFITCGGKFALLPAFSAIVLIIGIIVFICGKRMHLKKTKLGNSEMSLITSVNLGRDKTLHLVELDGEKLLIGASKNSVSLVKELAKPLNEKICESDFCEGNILGAADKKDTDETESKNYCDIEIPEVMQSEKEEPDIIGELFPQEETDEIEIAKSENAGYRVNPEDYTLYKKYLS